MPAAATTAVPPDLGFWVDRCLGAVGRGDAGLRVELVRYPGARRYWCRIRWPHGGVTNCDRTFAPGVLTLWLQVQFGIDAHELAWFAGEWAASEANPFTVGEVG